MENFRILICLIPFGILCHSAPQFENLNQGSNCGTVGGQRRVSNPDPDQPCIFPFKWSGISHNSCINDADGNWCSTQVNSRGEYIDKKWGICSSTCPVSDTYGSKCTPSGDTFSCYLTTKGDIKNEANLKEMCETKLKFSKWMNGRCYYFQNKEVKLFDDAQNMCSEIVKKHGFDNGRLYEPKDLDNFVEIYDLAEQFSGKPTLQLWLGLNDKSKEGQFVYSSNGQLPKFNTPWADSQPNGNTRENCLTTFKPSNDEMPMWYDRPCIENDVSDEPGHKFMCECTVPDQHIGKDCQDNSEEIDIASLGERTTVICQNGQNDGNEKPPKPSTGPVQTTNPINDGNIGPQTIIQGLCTKPEVVGGRVDIVDQDNQNRFGESAEIVLFKVTCFSDYQLRGSVFHLCEDGDYPNSTPSETICKRLPSGPMVRNSGLWKPDHRKGECGRSISPRANINEAIKSIDDYISIYLQLGYVNGEVAPFGEYPWMALLGYDPLKKGGSDNFYLCGGSLINKHYVLTAAHCIDTRNGPPVEVVLGEHDFGKDEDCDALGRFCSAPIIKRKINVKRDVIVHEKFNAGGNLENDIALIRIEEVVPLHQENEFKSGASPICLPWNTNLDEETKDDQIATGAGWGRTVGRKSTNSIRNVLNNNINVNELQELDLPIVNGKCINDPEITKIVRQFDPETQICAGGERGKDSCNGDSGGPLMVHKFDEETYQRTAYQIGLVSFGTETCGVGIPGVYTKVAKFLPWIAKNLKA